MGEAMGEAGEAQEDLKSSAGVGGTSSIGDGKGVGGAGREASVAASRAPSGSWKS